MQLEINCLDRYFLNNRIILLFLSCKRSHINFNHNFVVLFHCVFILHMSLRQWNTSFEHKQLTKITRSLALYQANLGVSQPEGEMMLESLSASSAASSSSSLSLSLSASGMDVDPVLLKLIVTTTTRNNKITLQFWIMAFSWGCTPTIIDLSESNVLENCCFCKVDLQTLTDNMWPLMLVHLCGDRSRITCVNQYTLKYESGILILLYHLSHPRRLQHGMEKIFGIQRSHLSAIMQTFS